MVQADVHYHGDLRGVYHVGGVQPAPQARLQHGDIAALLLEPQQGRRRHQLKLRGVLLHGLRRRLYPGDYIRQGLVLYLLAVYLHALVEAEQIGGGEKPRFVAAALEHRGEKGGAAALAVGAGDMYIFLTLLGPAQPFQQLPHPLQARLRAQPGHAVYVFQSLFVIHKPLPFSQNLYHTENIAPKALNGKGNSGKKVQKNVDLEQGL